MTPPVRPYPVRPDASAVSKTPRKTPGLLDMLAQMMGAIDERASSRFPEGTLLGELPSYIEGPKGVAKGVAKGVKQLSPAPATGIPENIAGVAYQTDAGRVVSKIGFDGGHASLFGDNWAKTHDLDRAGRLGFITNTGRYVDRAEGMRIAKAVRQYHRSGFEAPGLLGAESLVPVDAEHLAWLAKQP